jgi:methionyl-tRNA formyltransferase
MNSIILIAEGPTATTAVESLAEHFEVSAIFRMCLVANDPVAEFAVKHSIPLIRETSVRRIQSEVSLLRPACVVISSYDRLIPPEVLKLSPFVNVHYGPLPRYRGRANVNWAILNHESEAAITIHTIDSGLDSGNILFQRSVPIGPDSTVTELYGRLNKIQREELGSSVARHLSGYAGVAQSGLATYCCTRVPDDGELDWAAPTRDIYALIRALAPPYPGAYTFFRLQKVLIVKATPISNAPEYVGRVPGRACSVNIDSGAIDVLTGDGVLRVYELEDEAGIRTQAANLIRSTKATLGLTSLDLLQRIRQLEETLARLQDDVALQTMPHISALK